MIEFLARFDPRFAIGLVICDASCLIAGLAVIISFNTPCQLIWYRNITDILKYIICT
jgi:hypothetical protein